MNLYNFCLIQIRKCCLKFHEKSKIVSIYLIFVQFHQTIEKQLFIISCPSTSSYILNEKLTLFHFYEICYKDDSNILVDSKKFLIKNSNQLILQTYFENFGKIFNVIIFKVP